MNKLIKLAFLAICFGAASALAAGTPNWVAINTEQASGDESPSLSSAKDYTVYFCTVEAAEQIFGGASTVEAITDYLFNNYADGKTALSTSGTQLDASSYELGQYSFVKYFETAPVVADYLGIIFYDGDDGSEFRVFGSNNARRDEHWVVFDDDLSGVGEWTAPKVEPPSGGVETSEDVSLWYNRLSVNVTLASESGAKGVRVVLKNGLGAVVGTETNDVVNGMASVEFRDLTPGETYSYDVFLTADGTEYFTPDEWQTVSKDLFKSIGWFEFVTGVFTGATPDENIEIVDEMYEAKEGELGIVTPTGNFATGKRTVLETQILVEGAYATNDLPEIVNNQLSFGPVLKDDKAEDVPNNRVWAYKLGEADWTLLETCEAPVTNGTYTLRTVLDYRAGVKVASCTLTDGVGGYELFAEVALTADKMNRVGVIGGNVAYQTAYYSQVEPMEVEPQGQVIEFDSSAEVSLDKLNTGKPYEVSGNGYALSWKDADGLYATREGSVLTVHEGTPANGMSSFASYALGLDPTDAFDKPAAVVKREGHQSIEELTVNVPDVQNVIDSGVEAFHQLQCSENEGKTWVDVGEALPLGSDIKIPFDNKLYRVNTVLK